VWLGWVIWQEEEKRRDLIKMAMASYFFIGVQRRWHPTGHTGSYIRTVYTPMLTIYTVRHILVNLCGTAWIRQKTKNRIHLDFVCCAVQHLANMLDCVNTPIKCWILEGWRHFFSRKLHILLYGLHKNPGSFYFLLCTYPHSTSEQLFLSLSVKAKCQGVCT
jgi:hypothetical protein